MAKKINELETELTELEQLCDALQGMENALSTFLQKYFSQVGSLFQQIETLKHSAEPSNPVNDNYSPINCSFDVNRETKALYRKLIKSLHPDINPLKISTTEISNLNNAYNRRNLGSLKRIECDAAIENARPKELDAVTKLKQLSVRNARAKISLKMEQLANSPQYELMLRVKNSEEFGIDLIEEIRTEALEKIDILREESTAENPELHGA